uniref:Uncharacterized protein n=1 Tax=Hordeum vulgare subsp. vulgare TaxID=112509 RepID=A0A8I6XE99_HORVV
MNTVATCVSLRRLQPFFASMWLILIKTAGKKFYCSLLLYNIKDTYRFKYLKMKGKVLTNACKSCTAYQSQSVGLYFKDTYIQLEVVVYSDILKMLMN